MIFLLIEQADYVFGNESEVKAFVTTRGFKQDDDDAGEAAKYFARELFKNNTKQKLIVTRGEKSVLLVTQDTLEEIVVPKIDLKAGDAFVGGFISQIVKAKGVRECIEYGIITALSILTQVGCKLP